MNVKIINNKIVFSNKPRQNVEGALYLIYNRKLKDSDTNVIAKNKERKKMNLSEVKHIAEDAMLDVNKGQTEYELPEGVTKKDIEALYLRML